MNRSTVQATYQLSDQVLSDYDTWVRHDETKPDERQYDDADLVYLQTIAALYTMGFTAAEVATYLQFDERNQRTTEQRLGLLTRKRKERLAEIHQCESQVAAIDYLRFHLNDQNKGAENDG
ncbi:MerR family transcriptional regulator [Levilactobacillus cerevisiae]|uniref:hypothetical protein n=1 Tax=Levilactobacillus cerevisiae TaxID=1704076 RepID=UPI000F76852C|nr:hypothetical protein [Levilactobacillus cerevisiae]